MGKIRVEDLARMMGIANQDLIFKLKSIGVRVEGEEAQLDTDIIQAILQGKRLAAPREVILRDEQNEEDEVQVRHAPIKRPAPPSFRPARRAMIHRVEPKIRNIEVKERLPGEQQTVASTAVAEPEAPLEQSPTPPPEQEAKAKTTAKAEPATEAKPTKAAKSTKPDKVVKKDKPAAATKDKATKPAAADKKPVAAKRPARPPAGRPPATRPPATRPPAGRPPSRPAGRVPPRPPAPRGRRVQMRSDRRITAIPRSRPPARSTRTPTAPPPKKMEPVSERGKRRAERRMKTSDDALPTFKETRPEGPVTLTEGMTVREFAEKLGVKAKDLIKSLVTRGVMANINHILDPETAEELAAELGVETMQVTFEEEAQLQAESELEGSDAEKVTRAPVVTVMGHVDHGKTTLLDAIRSADVAAGEAGGITQHIGAYHVDVDDRKIVFLDTPGHEAFTLMRARGASVTDIVVLVVAADDGVMPQTVEAIDHARAADVPIIIAINKIDKNNANPDRVKKELADRGLMVEEWGGEIVSVPVSALKKEGVKELLEMILLTSDLLDLKAAPELPAQGAVLEARKDIGRGVVATVLVNDGTLRIGDTFVAGTASGRVRSMSDDRGERLKEAGPATPVEVTGFNDLPNAGENLQVVDDDSKARSIADFRQREERQRELSPQVGRLSLEQLFDQISQDEVKELPVVIKADVHGSVEVLKDTLEKLSTDKVKVKVLHSAVGAITTNNVLLASASEAIIIGFNVRPERNASSLAEKEGVEIRLHTVIYELVDELRRAMTGLLEPTFQEAQKGTAEIREVFKIPKIGVVAGCHVIEGVIPRSAQVRLLRDNRVVYEGKIASLRRFKDDASEVRTGFDCGIGLDHFQDFKPGDKIEAFVREEVAPSL